MKLSGILPALVTPLREDETLNVPVLRDLIEHFLSQGACGFYVGGATGEGLALRPEVRMDLAREAVKAAAGRAPVIVHIAAMDFSVARSLARQAREAGADGVSAVPPFYFTYRPEDIADYYRVLTREAGIPMMIYNTPAAGAVMNAEQIARLFGIEGVEAVKWTSPRYDEMIRLIDRTEGKMTVMNGPDETLLLGLSAGAAGAIGTTYNLALPTALRIYQAFGQGDLPAARAEQARLERLIETVTRQPLIPSVKAVLTARGFAVGNAAFPQMRFSPDAARRLAEEVAAILAE